MTTRFYVIRYRATPESKGMDEYLVKPADGAGPVTTSAPEAAAQFESRKLAEDYLAYHNLSALRAPDDHHQMADVAQVVVVVEKSVRVS